MDIKFTIEAVKTMNNDRSYLIITDHEKMGTRYREAEMEIKAVFTGQEAMDLAEKIEKFFEKIFNGEDV